MAVTIKDNIFSIETENTLYQIKADEYGVLCHLWYGAKTDCRMDYLLDYHDVGFSGNPYEAEDKRNYSLDTLPLEYAAEGTGDYRTSAISITHKDGSRALDLRFQEYRLNKGKYSIPGLPAVYAQESEAETLEIILKDTLSEIQVVLRYGILEKADIITRSAVITNSGEMPVTINKAHSLCIDMPYGDLEWVHFQGRHMMERQPERTPLIYGRQESGSVRGTSSHQQNPAVLLCEKSCTEHTGFCIGAALMYSGGFQAQAERDQLGQARLVMGIHPDTFSWALSAGESFYTPEAILSCSNEGMAVLSQRFHYVIRNHVCRGKYKLGSRPVLINNWEATYFNFDEQKILNIAKQASELGIEMMVLDDGWFGKRESDTSGLGDWFVNEKKLKGGLQPLIKQINEMGMKFGIWFEPEAISEDSRLYQEHPEWAIHIPGRKPVRARYQLVLDMSNPAVIDYLYSAISKILKENHIEYVKWDMNRSISDWYTDSLPGERQMEMPHRYVLGLYELLERLTQDFPDVLFEGCSGGGGRFEAGMLFYCPQIWCSDDTDAHERTFIQYGTSFFYPISAVGSHVSAVPNHQTGRSVSLKTRGIVAMAGSFGYELDLNCLSDKEKDEVARQVKRYREYQKLIYDGKYERLSNPFEDGMAAWSWISEDKKQVLVHGVVFRTAANALRRRLRLFGLDEKAVYKISESGETITGAALMSGGILLPRMSGDDAAFEIYLEV